MSTYLVYPVEIAKESSLINYINGKGPFWVENPFFAKNVNKSVDAKKWLDEYVTKGSSNKDRQKFIISSPKIYIKNTKTGEYTDKFFIRWTPGGKKEYNIWKPYSANVSAIGTIKIPISPVSKDNVDGNLMLIQHQLSMVLEVLIVSKMFDLDLSEYDGMTNDDFYMTLMGEINEKIQPLIKSKDHSTIEINEEMISDFNSPPTWSFNSFDDMRVPSDEEMNIRYYTLLQTICKYIRDRRTSAKISSHDIYNKIMGNGNGLKQFYVFPTYSATISRDQKTDVVKKAFEIAKCEFRCQTEKSKYATELKTSHTSSTYLTKENIPMIWGGDKGKMRFEGCIYVSLSFDTRMYPTGKGTFSISFSVHKMMGTLSNSVPIKFNDDDLCDEIFGANTEEIMIDPIEMI